MPEDEARPPTRYEIIAEQQKLGLTNAEFAAVLGYKRGETISDWKQPRPRHGPKITYAEMLRRIAAHTGRTDPTEQGRRDRDYTVAIIALIKGDALDIAASAKRQLDKLEVAERFLSGTPSLLDPAEADERAVSADLHAERVAAQATRRKRGGHR